MCVSALLAASRAARVLLVVSCLAGWMCADSHAVRLQQGLQVYLTALFRAFLFWQKKYEKMDGGGIPEWNLSYQINMFCSLSIV
jgi:hypothetical protein